MSIVLSSISLVSIVGMWPPKLSFMWFLMPVLAIGSIIIGFNYAHWIIAPRDVSIEISEDMIQINDQPIFKWKERCFDPKKIEMIHHSPEGGTVLIDKNGRHHIVGDVIMMKKKVIFRALKSMHPHIKIKSDQKPNKANGADLKAYLRLYLP